MWIHIIGQIGESNFIADQEQRLPSPSVLKLLLVTIPMTAVFPSAA